MNSDQPAAGIGPLFTVPDVERAREAFRDKPKQLVDKQMTVTEAVQRSFQDLGGHEGYLCGSPGMIDASIKVFQDLGMPEDKIYYDKFA